MENTLDKIKHLITYALANGIQYDSIGLPYEEMETLPTLEGLPVPVVPADKPVLLYKGIPLATYDLQSEKIVKVDTNTKLVLEKIDVTSLTNDLATEFLKIISTAADSITKLKKSEVSFLSDRINFLTEVLEKLINRLECFVTYELQERGIEPSKLEGDPYGSLFVMEDTPMKEGLNTLDTGVSIKIPKGWSFDILPHPEILKKEISLIKYSCSPFVTLTLHSMGDLLVSSGTPVCYIRFMPVFPAMWEKETSR